MAKDNKAQIISQCRGIYARVARKLGVHPSMVSLVASGKRKSIKIDAALHEELKGLLKLLADYEK